MLRIGVGLSTERDSASAAAEAAAVALRSGGLERADCLLVFATTPHGPGFTRVTRTAGEVCGTRQIIGCSAAGVLAGEQEVEGGPGVAVLAVQGDLVARRFFVPIARRGGEALADDIAEAVGQVTGPEPLLFLFADSYHLEADTLLRGLARRLPGVRVFGGGASEDGSVGETSVFAGDTASSDAVAGALLSGDLAATVGVAHAVRRVGPVHRVTRLRDGWVLELDGRRAYEALAAIVPASLLEDRQRAAAVVLAGVPVGDGEFVVRHLAGIDALQGAVAVAAPLSLGDELFFGVRDPHSARNDLERVLVRQRQIWQKRPAAGALYVNCVARGRALHGVQGLDTAYIRRQLGPLPVAGFFSGAEFAPGGAAPRLHQYTGVLAVFGPGR